MDVDTSLRHEFARLEAIADDHARGRMFEDLVQRLFERSRFQVDRNPDAAHPRQTDLFVRYGADEYLIEVKWQKRAVDINDLDSLRSRMGRVPHHVGGIFFALPGFTTPACADVEQRRERVILLVNEDEIRRLFAGQLDLPALIRRKKQSYSTEGRVFFDIGQSLWAGRPVPQRATLPEADVEIWRPPQDVVPWVMGAGGFGPLVFIQDLPDIGRGVMDGRGMSLDLPLYLATRKDLAHVIDALRRCLGVSSAARYAIQQASVCWHGAGAAGLLDALDAWKTRYRVATTRFHHSEEVNYFDQCEGAFFTLSAQVGATDERRVHMAELSVRLDGMPLDPTPWQHLMESLGRDGPTYFRPTTCAAIRRMGRWPRGDLPLTPVAFLRLRGEEWLKGLVAKNPFFGKDGFPLRTARDRDVFALLSQQEYLVCGMGSYHQTERLGRQYSLCALYVAETDDVTAVYPAADWED